MQTKHKSYKGLIYILLVLLSLFMLVPFYWMVISSLKLNKDVFSIPMKWWPDSIHWNNYQIIWKKLPLTTFFLNTAKLTICTTVIQLFTSCLAAYEMCIRDRICACSILISRSFFSFSLSTLVSKRLEMRPDI